MPWHPCKGINKSCSFAFICLAGAFMQATSEMPGTQLGLKEMTLMQVSDN